VCCIVLSFLIFVCAPSGAVGRDASDQNKIISADAGGYDTGQAAYASGRFVDALRIWEPLAEKGDPQAAFGVGLLYDLGQGLEQNAAAAYTWYLRAAEEGFVPAQFNIGIMYDSGLGTARNATNAAAWYATAAAHGHARAAYNLALLYATGDGVPRNVEVAKAWFAAAAAHGLSAASGKLVSLREQHTSLAVSTAIKPLLNPVTPTGPLLNRIMKSDADSSVELSWIAPAQPVAVAFFVEVLALDTSGYHAAFTSYLDRSSIVVRLPATPGEYAWRVYVVAASLPDYVPSAWSYFAIY